MVVIPSLLQCVAEHLQQLACHVGSRRYRKAFTQISTTDTRLRERKRALAERPTRARFAGALKGRLLECTHVRRIANAAPRGRMPGKRARARTNFGHARFAGTIATAIAQILCTWKGNTMKQPSDVFNDLQARIGDLLKNSPAKDVERNVKAMLTQGFSKLDLVTREEFDTQAQVLARTRARLEELEKRVAELEQKLADVQS
ncbi:hypothetical protein BpKM390_04030 [Burkholderia pseudomallei]|nr:conserved hypothetical protein [Burkholderia pseudomallei 1710b]BEH17209.1 hypothetical protein GTC019_03870 [Burkholderia pseudomallei]BEH23221.1 hypothetical protein GTC050_04730 [Burkholderia pseudomallei]BEH29217.1 hypothetical protein GTC054_04330 [Burkholderia pseudomallei]BEH35343.1 hypothetical protein GTC254T_04380 [Burkholderia pseudomallei]